MGCLCWVYPAWDSLGFLDLGDYFLPYFREVFNYYLLKYFLMVFLFVFFFSNSYNLNVGAFNIVLEVSEIVLISFNSFFFFTTLSMACHSLLACRVSVERSALILNGIHLYVVCSFSFDAFNICSLCLIFVSLIYMCLGRFLLGFILYVTLWASWTWVAISYPTLGKFLTIISSNIFQCPFLLISFSGMPMI